MQKLAKIFREHKLKVTPQRLAIYSMLANSKSHPSAEKIHNALKDTHPTMSLATVYKTLDILKSYSLIQELNVGEGSFRYDATVVSHAHFTCRICKEVSDIDDVDAEEIINEVKGKSDFIVEHTQLIFYGVCETCKKTLYSNISYC